MFEKFLSKDAADFQQRYRGTFGFYKAKGVRILVQLADVNARCVTFVDNAGMVYTLNADSEEDIGFEFITPKCAYHNTPDGAPLLVQRIAAKQYSRGVCEKNTRILGANGMQFPVDFHWLTKIYGATTPFHAALEALTNPANVLVSNSGVALSSQFAYWHTGNKLKCFNIIIGDAELDPKTKTMTYELLDNSMWEQEVKDVLRRNNIKGVSK